MDRVCPKKSGLAMSELYDSLTGTLAIFGYAVPIDWLIAFFCLLVSVFFRSIWPAMLGGITLYFLYFIPSITG